MFWWSHERRIRKLERKVDLMPQVQVDQDELNNLITGLQTVQGEAANATSFVAQLESQLASVQSAPVTPGLPTVDLSAAVATLVGVKTALGNIGAAAAIAPPAAPAAAPAPAQDFSEPAVLAAAAQTEGGATAAPATDQSQAAAQPAVSVAGDASAPSAQVTGTSAGEPAPAVAAPATADAAPAPAADTTANEPAAPAPPPSGQ